MSSESEVHNSQELLAQSIARAIHSEFPLSGDEGELADSAEDALRREAFAFELTVAYLRVGFLAIVVIHIGFNARLLAAHARRVDTGLR